MKKFLLFLSMTVFIACSDEDDIISPSVSIQEIIETSSSSVEVRLNLNYGSQKGAIYGGYYLDEVPGIDIFSSKKETVDPYLTDKIEIRNLQPGKSYYLMFFLPGLNGEEIYSEEVNFIMGTPTNVLLERDSLDRGIPITLKGANLSKDSSAYSISVGGTLSRLLTIHDDSIIFELPLSTTPGLQKIQIDILGYNVIEKAVYINPWNKINNLPYFIWNLGPVMAFEDKLFTMLDEYHLDINDETEELKTNEVWYLDLNSNTWEHTGISFPGEYRRYSRTITYNGKGYLFKGFTEEKSFDDLWEFSPESRSWRNISNIPSSFSNNVRVLGIGNKLFFHEDTTFMSFDLTSEQWKEEPSFDLTSPVLTSLRTDVQYSINGMGYYLGWKPGEGPVMFLFNPQLEQWSEIGPFTPEYAHAGFYLVIDGIGVYGNGILFSERYYDYYTFNPETGLWNKFFRAPKVLWGSMAFSSNSKNLFVKNGSEIFMFTPNF